ncbi:G-protein coupled receptor moody [Eumeta japonica]|uniref:G-protein coupled receptor moody n=1 Tax=Eumeta variegata TaxID=151549 RepID=A0A4C1VVE8_EUMVA|nr:G-protein coupled receptor moody [Eumeta japonica]
MREHQRSQPGGAGSLNNTDKRSTVKDTRESKARRNEWRITKMVLAIFLSFLVCYLPITLAKVADVHVNYPGKLLSIVGLAREPGLSEALHELKSFHIAGYLLLYASACVNPIIYVIMNAQYRAAYAAVLCCSAISRLPGLTSGAYTSHHANVNACVKKTERTSTQPTYLRA